ncbi:MAG: DNA helicase RecG, partial [Patescibacteria group bacterium]|nr:DNA helicase RecG [Patescibacteria group bacterium]
FGLAQLHQFRGRVGRSSHQSYCFLFTSDNAPPTTGRLRVMEQTNNGFKIAEADLKFRGPGQFMGTLQSGLPDITMESLTDVKLIRASRTEAQRLLAFDPHLKKFPSLKKNIEKMEMTTHWE